MGTRPSALLMQLFICMATQICCGRESVSVIMFAQIFTCIFMGSDGEYAAGNDWFTSFHFCVLEIFLLCFLFCFSLFLFQIFLFPFPPYFRSSWNNISEKFCNSMFPLNDVDCTLQYHTYSLSPRRTFAICN